MQNRFNAQREAAARRDRAVHDDQLDFINDVSTTEEQGFQDAVEEAGDAVAALAPTSVSAADSNGWSHVEYHHQRQRICNGLSNHPLVLRDRELAANQGNYYSLFSLGSNFS
jgi:hypothetical protein